MILAGDIGGTKTNVAIFETNGLDRNLTTLAQGSYPSAEYKSLEAILEDFLAKHDVTVTRACFGIAGPIDEECIETPNLKWTVCESTLLKALKLKRVKLMNDLEATASGITTLKAAQLFTLNEGDTSPEGNGALIAAGTGLGMAGIVNHEGRSRPLASEGGHADFAPRSETEIGLLRHLMKLYDGHISYERVLSGTGLFNIYMFLREEGYSDEPDWLAAQTEADDKRAAIAAISNAGLDRKSELASKALDLFVGIYGAAAGNLALMMKATGGVYVGGGIAPKIIERLADGTFMRAFLSKGRFSEFLAKVHVRVILDDRTALYGAAQCALEEEG